MAGINNLAGTKITDYKILYKEEVEKGLWFMIFQQYLEGYDKPHCSHGTQFTIQTVVTETPSFYTANNGILCVNEVIHEELLQSEPFNPLKSTKSKDGFEIYQWSSIMREWEWEGKKYKSRLLKWAVKVPLENLLKFIK